MLVYSFYEKSNPFIVIYVRQYHVLFTNVLRKPIYYYKKYFYVMQLLLFTTSRFFSSHGHSDF